MSSITVPSSSSSSILFSDPIKLGSVKPGFRSNSVKCCSLDFKRYDVPKLKPFSRTMFDRYMESIPVPLIQKTEDELSDYCTTLEGDECYSCWVACSELEELESTQPETVVHRIINQEPGLRSLITHLHKITPFYRENKIAALSSTLKPSIVDDKTPKPENVENNNAERRKPFPVPEELPKTEEEMEEEEKAKMPDSDSTRMLRIFGKFPAWYTPRPDHETD